MAKDLKFKGSLGTYTIEETQDGSPTLHSDFFQESCHSKAGAVAETLHNYVYGTQVLDKIKEAPVCLFELGFATGLGVSCTLEEIKKLKTNRSSHSTQPTKLFPLSFISCELDQELAQEFLKRLQESGYIRNLSLVSNSNLSYFHGDFCDSFVAGELIVLVGDIRETLPLWRNHKKFQKFHAIYQDPFSPKRNPTLWTKEWFDLLKTCSEESVSLSTYSSTKAVWKAMMAAGWAVFAVKGYGQKRLSTRAKLTGESGPDVLEWCHRSPVPPLSDTSAS